MSLVLGFSVIAQQRTMKNDARQSVASGKIATVGKEISPETSNYVPQEPRSVVVNRWDDMEDAEILWTTYDLQSNQYVANRMVQWGNGNVAAVATMSHEYNLTASDRGTGYNFYNGSDWDEEPEARFEPWKTGWPSIAQWGENGEILLCHGNGGMQCFTRENAGEGEWEYKGALPAYPEGYPYTEYATWPRVVTCGDNHNIIVAVATLQHSISSDETDIRTCFWRSEDAENWTCSYGPIADLGLGYEIGNFSADDYCMAAKGHKVALVYSGCLTNSVWLFTSEDDGLTWTSTKVWEHPFEGVELDEPGLDYGDTLFAPMNSSVVIDNSGVVHIAMNTFEFSHFLDTQAGYYSYWAGRSVDGILYWNSTQEAPIQSPDGNPFHAARLWWPIPGEPGYVHMENDSTRWIGMIPMFDDENGNLIQWDNDKFYNDNYHSKMYGASAHPVLCCDDNDNLACAFSSPTTYRESADPNGTMYYLRGIFVSYKNADEDFWNQLEDELTEDFMYGVNDNLFTISVLNTINTGEFWFGFQSDDQIGFAWGTEPTQSSTSENQIHVCKVINTQFTNVPENTEAQDVVYRVYPNPATDYMVVSSAMETEATVTVYNLVGQVVKQFDKHLVLGDNMLNIDLKSGVYFCTISANGFDKTVKVVVK